MMARTRFQSSNIGAMCAIPLLFTLLAFAAVHCVANSAIASAERQEIDAAQARVRAEQEAAKALRRQGEVLLHQIRVIEAEIERLQELIDEFETKGKVLEELRYRLGQYRAEVERLRHKLAELHHRLTVAENRLREVDERKQRIKNGLQSRNKLDEQNKKLRDEIEKLRKDIEAKEIEIGLARKGQKSVDLEVVGGKTRVAVFVECDAQGVMLMPERTRLGKEAKPDDQEVFLRKARSKGIVFFAIRPDGVDSFNTYYRIVQTYNGTVTRRIDTGYEPVDSDWEMNYPKN